MMISGAGLGSVLSWLWNGTMLTIDGPHDESYLSRVGGTGKVCVDLFCFCLVERNKSVQDVVTSGGVIRST